MKVLVTGASRGIGKSIAERFCAGGYEVLRPTRVEMDLASPESVEKYMAGAPELDALVNCAGVLRAGPASEADLDWTLRVNLSAPLQVARAARMKRGRIVNVSSIWGSISKPGRAAYSASKAGLDGLTRALALEWAPVLVNAVAPGYTETDMLHEYNSEEDLARIRDTIPLGRFCSTAEVAELVFFLGSEQNGYVTGQVIPIDGGFSVQ